MNILTVSFLVKFMRSYPSCEKALVHILYSENPLNSSAQFQGDRFLRYVAFGNLFNYSLLKI